MKIGDLVFLKLRPVHQRDDHVGVIIEKGVYAGNRDTLVMISSKEIFTEKSILLEVINESS